MAKTQKVGRPSSFNAEIGEAICLEVAGGSNLCRISQREDMPPLGTIYRWLRDFPEFREMYAHARDDRADGRNDRIDELQQQLDAIAADARAGNIEPGAGHAAVSAIRAQIDALKWQAAHESPKRYGERLELAGDKNAPLRVDTELTVRLVSAPAVPQGLPEPEEGRKIEA